MKKHLLVVTTTLGLILAVLSGINAAVISVPTDQPTVQAGVDAALAGDTVLIAPGTYEESVLVVGKSLTITSEFILSADEQDIHTTMIDSISFESCADLAELTGLTVGMELRAESSHLTVDHCRIKRIYCRYSDLTISDCEVSGGSAKAGGGMLVSSSTVVIDLTLFRENTAVGGLVWCNNPFGWDISSYSAGQGGAIYSTGSALFISNCTFVDNQAIDILPNDDLSRSCGFFDSQGGAILVAVDPDESMRIENCLFYGNGAEYAGAVNVWGGTDSVFFSGCNIYGNDGGDWTDDIADQLGVNGNFSCDPLFCDPASGDYHLAVQSACAPLNSPTGTLIGSLGVGCSCINGTGNADCDPEDKIDIGDMTALIKYLFVSGFEELPCFDEANADGQGTVDIADLTALISYLFIPPFPEPSPCQ